MARGRRIPIPASPGQFVDFAGSGSAVRRGTSLGFLFGLLVAVDLIRRGWPATPIPDMRRLVLGYAGAVFAIGVFAVIAPGFATALLVGLIVVSMIRAAPAIEAWTRQTAAAIWPVATTPAAGRTSAVVRN
jgi:hypothetical protein